jgi:hypothetical protein
MINGAAFTNPECFGAPLDGAENRDIAEPRGHCPSIVARSRGPFVAVMSGAFTSACACFSESQLARRTPLEATPFTRVIPTASSGASSPLAAASAASSAPR